MDMLSGSLAALILVIVAQGTGGMSDDAAVRAVVQRYMDARDHQSAAEVEALFTADADQLVSSGEWRKGRSQVVAGTLASSRNSGGKRTIAVESVRFVAPGVALADGRYELTGLQDGSSRRMWSTLVVIRGPDGWRITAIRNMLPAPLPPSNEWAVHRMS